MKALTEEEVFEAFYAGTPASKIHAPDVKYNEVAEKLGLELLPESPIFTEAFLMPEEYKSLDLTGYFSDKITTDEEAERVAEELSLFIESGNEEFLRYLIYLSDIVKKNDIIIGVGRGSSVSVYLLYKIGLHKVDSLKYKLDYKEFFKIKE